jgi:hypothetical protein
LRSRSAGDGVLDIIRGAWLWWTDPFALSSVWFLPVLVLYTAVDLGLVAAGVINWASPGFWVLNGAMLVQDTGFALRRVPVHHQPRRELRRWLWMVLICVAATAFETWFFGLPYYPR